MRGLFCDRVWELDRSTGSKAHKMWLLPQDWSTLEFLIFRLAHIEPATIPSQFRFSYPSTSLHGGFSWWVSILLSSNFLYLPGCFSNFGHSSLPCDLISLVDLRRNVDFLACSDFYFLLIWSANFQASYVPDWKAKLFCLLLRFNYYWIFILAPYLKASRQTFCIVKWMSFHWVLLLSKLPTPWEKTRPNFKWVTGLIISLKT